MVKFLQKYNILLSPSHHRYHHSHDNMNYAFLNGLSDPLINIIAKKMKFTGYKNNADQHVKSWNATNN